MSHRSTPPSVYQLDGIAASAIGLRSVSDLYPFWRSEITHTEGAEFFPLRVSEDGATPIGDEDIKRRVMVVPAAPRVMRVRAVSSRRMIVS